MGGRKITIIKEIAFITFEREVYKSNILSPYMVTVTGWKPLEDRRERERGSERFSSFLLSRVFGRHGAHGKVGALLMPYANQ